MHDMMSDGKGTFCSIHIVMPVCTPSIWDFERAVHVALVAIAQDLSFVILACHMACRERFEAHDAQVNHAEPVSVYGQQPAMVPLSPQPTYPQQWRV